MLQFQEVRESPRILKLSNSKNKKKKYFLFPIFTKEEKKSFLTSSIPIPIFQWNSSCVYPDAFQ